ncbi:hypothetical protein HispidOSU_005770 [Sigmodon hispidus]
MKIGAGLGVLIDNPSVRLGQSPAPDPAGGRGGISCGRRRAGLGKEEKGVAGGGGQWRPASGVPGTEHSQPDPRRGGWERSPGLVHGCRLMLERMLIALWMSIYWCF